VVDWIPSAEVTTDEYPFLLTTGRALFQFNAGTMTGRTPHGSLHPRDVLSISPDDARRLGIRDGDHVRLRSRHGEAVLPARLDPGMRPGELFATFHTVEAFLNRVTGRSRDTQTGTPEYKVTAVTIGG
jgi:formate dehydrogenase major subunit